MSLELTKEKYVELKKQKRSDERITSEYGLSRTKLLRMKKTWGLAGSKKSGKTVSKSKPVQEPPHEPGLKGLLDQWKEEARKLANELADCKEDLRLQAIQLDEADERAARLPDLEEENRMLKALLKIYL